MCRSKRKIVLKISDDGKENQQMEGKSPAYIEKERPTAWPSRPSFGSHPLGVQPIGIIRQCSHAARLVSKLNVLKWLAAMLTETALSGFSWCSRRHNGRETIGSRDDVSQLSGSACL